MHGDTGDARPFNILMIVESALAGTGRHVIDVVDGLLERGHAVSLVYSAGRMDETFRTWLADVPLVDKQEIAMHREIGLHDLTSLIAIWKYVRANGPFDIIHGHSSKGGAMARLLPGVPGKRFYTSLAFRTMDPNISSRQRLVYSALERFMARYLTDCVIVACDQERDAGRAMGIPDEKMRFAYNGIRMKEVGERARIRRDLGYADDDFLVGFVGRFSWQKAPERLPNGIALIDDPKVKGVMLGHGELQGQLEDRIKALDLEGRVRIIAGLDGLYTMPGFDVLMVPSRYESTGYVFLEADQVGLPIIGTDTGVGKEIIDADRHSQLVGNIDEPEAWATAIERAKTSIEHARANPGDSPPRVPVYSWEGLVQDVVDAYEAVCR